MLIFFFAFLEMIEHLGYAEVGNFDVEVPIDQQIAALEVSVNDRRVLAMKVRHSSGSMKKLTKKKKYCFFKLAISTVPFV